MGYNMIASRLSSSIRREDMINSFPIQCHEVAERVHTVSLSFRVATRRNANLNTQAICNTAASQEIPISPRDGKKKVVEERWRIFFSDPSQWWDHRVGKTSTRYPDFKHKETGEALWVYDKSNPEWVQEELDSIAPGTVPLPILFWNKKLARYVREGKDRMALEFFQQFQQEGRNPDSFTFVSVLKACGTLRSLEEGRAIHKKLIESGCELSPFVGSALIRMYTKCGKSEDARMIFNKMPTKDVISWSAMIGGYVHCEQGQKALELYELMQVAQLEPDKVTYVGVISACAKLEALEKGRRVHEQIIRSGCESDPFVGSSLVHMYAKCGSIDEAQGMFSKMSTPDVVCWTAMIAGYVKCGKGRKALDLYETMQVEQVEPVPLTFVGVLNACARLGDLEEGRRVHKEIIQSGSESHVFVGTSLVDMYAKCGAVEEAQRVFNSMTIRTVVSWNAMIMGYVKCGRGQMALRLYQQMLVEGVEPSPATFVGGLNACTSLLALHEGRQIHSQISKCICEQDIFVGSSLVDMYAKCGSIEDAWNCFNNMHTRDMVAWTAMILGLVKCGQGQRALELYQQMQLEGVEPAPDSLIMVLSAYGLGDTLQESTDTKAEVC